MLKVSIKPGPYSQQTQSEVFNVNLRTNLTRATLWFMSNKSDKFFSYALYCCSYITWRLFLISQ